MAVPLLPKPLAAKETLQEDNIHAKILMPYLMPGKEKTDWNDVHRLKGLSQVKHQLGLIPNDSNIHTMANRLNYNEEEKVRSYSNDFSYARNNRIKNEDLKLDEENYEKYTASEKKKTIDFNPKIQDKHQKINPKLIHGNVEIEI